MERSELEQAKFGIEMLEREMRNADICCPIDAKEYVSIDDLCLAIEALEQPEIIYCKDCKHNHKNWDVWGNNFCSKTEQCSDDDCFCYWAERIDDGEK